MAWCRLWVRTFFFLWFLILINPSVPALGLLFHRKTHFRAFFHCFSLFFLTSFWADFTSHLKYQSNKKYLLYCQMAGLLGLLGSQLEAHYFWQINLHRLPLDTSALCRPYIFLSAFLFLFLPRNRANVQGAGIWPEDNLFPVHLFSISLCERVCVCAFVCAWALSVVHWIIEWLQSTLYHCFEKCRLNKVIMKLSPFLSVSHRY